jgi:hypothetical protein
MAVFFALKEDVAISNFAISRCCSIAMRSSPASLLNSSSVSWEYGPTHRTRIRAHNCWILASLEVGTPRFYPRSTIRTIQVLPEQIGQSKNAALHSEDSPSCNIFVQSATPVDSGCQSKPRLFICLNGDDSPGSGPFIWS